MVRDYPRSGLLQRAEDYLRHLAQRPGVHPTLAQRLQNVLDEWDARAGTVDARRELLAELHANPRRERPFWVAEQLEVALFEGIWGRVVWAAAGRITDRWRLDSIADLHRIDPEMYGLSDEEIATIKPGMIAFGLGAGR
jgi:hypothetical protein